MRHRVLLHCCCAPCSSAIIEWMLANGEQPVLFYSNPNIYPEEEYMIRRNECVRYAGKLGLEFIEDRYDHDEWQNWVRGHEEQPERGSRCLECFRMRLQRAAAKARELGIETFTSTLASSRWKSLEQIALAGNWAADGVNAASPDSVPLRFDARNWRKGGLQQRRNELLRENGFYNQLYCGCEYSLNARLPMMGKDDVRRWMRELKRAHTAQELKEMSTDVCGMVMSGALWQNAGTVLLYHALPDEVDTQLLLEDALLSGKRVLLPKVKGDDLVLCEYTGPESLMVGAYGILEPDGRSAVCEDSMIDLAVIPGMAFDRQGHRLGRGKGYYDRLLCNLKAYKMGVCFPFQLLEQLPHEEHDVRMDGVVSTALSCQKVRR